ncbi:MAG: DUF2281 domain-containing protein [Spirochaetota bacterium]|nr:DUF2281 domain-containing protein [Spirochaetota bacterium]
MKYQDIESKIDKLPEHVKQEINDFIDFLLAKYGEKKNKKKQIQI